MSDFDNPYKSPEAGTQVMDELVSQGGLTENMLKNLNDASPWLRFMGVIGFIGSGFMALSGAFFIGMAPLLNRAFGEFGDVFDGFFGAFGSIAYVYALYFIGAGAVMFFPAFFTYRFGAKIGEYMRSSTPADLEQAFRNNRLLWKFNGILMIIGLAFIPVMIIIMIIAAVALAIAS